MASQINRSNCLIASEFDEAAKSKWFNYTRDKFVNHIDTFYYVVYVDSYDWRDDPRRVNLMSAINAASDLALSSTNLFAPVFEQIYKGLICQPNMHFNMYASHFSLKDAFDVFVADYTPNSDTPPIFVQLRSNALWLHGVKKTFGMSVDCVRKVLASYGISITKIVENRLDYAFHTNYIQDPLHFFPESDLNEMQISQFHRWHKEGFFAFDNIECDYFTLGRRKSNNVFFRVYNKSKEVIELGYKQFFIPIWYDQGLISLYDKFLLEVAFERGAWSSVHYARCYFYYVHGSDKAVKDQLAALFRNPDTPAATYKKIADTLVPSLTIVCNVEFQCKRKFFYNIRTTFVDYGVYNNYMDHMYSVIDQTKSIIRHLTTNILRFVSYKGKYADVPRAQRPDASWWQRLRSSKAFELVDDSYSEYCFAYQNSIDIARVRYSTLKSVARTSAYSCYTDIDVDSHTYIDDFSAFCTHMNDNDIHKYYSIKSSAFDSINRKRMQLIENKCKDESHACMRYRSQFIYWINGIYNRRLDPRAFVAIVSDSFASDTSASEVFFVIMDGYKKKYQLQHDKKSEALYNICWNALNGVHDYRLKRGGV